MYDTEETETLLQQLRRVNVSRAKRWHGPDSEPWSGADWSNAMAGEAGEACNVVKKLRRGETGAEAQDQPARSDLLGKLADELADTLIYADLLAAHYGLDLEAALCRKYNAVSVREGYPERLVLR